MGGTGYRSKRIKKKKQTRFEEKPAKTLEYYTSKGKVKIAKESLKFVAEVIFDYYGLSFFTTAIETAVKAYKTYTETGSIQKAVEIGISTMARKMYSDIVAKGVMSAIGVKGGKLMKTVVEKALSRTFEEIAEKASKESKNNE